MRFRKKSRVRKRMIGRDPSLCHLCGLVIPTKVVSPTHALFGTIDHVIARSRHGSDAVYNRAPAHRICNARKANGVINPEQFAAELHRLVAPLLERLGYTVSAAARRRAIRRVVQGWPLWVPTWRTETQRIALQRWEDDGGRVL